MKPGGPLQRNTPLSRRTPLVAKVGLVVKTPLRASRAPLSRDTALKARGAKTNRLALFQAFHRTLTLLRAKGRCEICGRAQDPPDWHHLFGRSLGVKGGSKWVNVTELTVGACWLCHHNWHQTTLFGIPLANHWRWVGLHRLAKAYLPVWLEDESFKRCEGSPYRAAREMIAELVEKGVEPRCL